MEFGLDAGQLELQQTVARYCTDRFPPEEIAAREGAPVDRTAWADLAAVGVFGLLLPEDAGGSGLGAVEAALVFEQLGSHLVPGPMLWTVLAAPFVDGVAAGTVLVGGALVDADDDGALLVEHAADVDVVLVVREDVIVAHRTVGGAPPEPLAPLDPLTPVGRVRDLGAGDAVGGRDAAHELRVLGTVLSAAMLVGVAGRAVEVARDHALERHQFGVPIGSFQAVQHLVADMHVRHGLAQSAAYAAAALVQDPRDDDPATAAARAKLLAGDAAIANASTAVQVLGGMGFTWAMLPNHLLKRAWVLEQGFGTADAHAAALGAALVGGRG
jgi:alkylation response protein AidB-like acyl-CoA dehydrogenase